MEGGGRGSLLDPGAAEFHPATSQLSLGHPQIYYTYPPRPPPSLPPPPPQPVVTVSVFPLQQQLHHMEVVAPAVAVATRAVELSMVPRNVGEAELRAAMEVFGGVRAVEMRRLVEEGVVIIHYFDLRSAEMAVMEVRKTHARLHTRIGYGGNWAAQWLGNGGGRGTVAGHPVWAQFAADLNDPNQGSLLVHNSDMGLSLRVLRELFEPFVPCDDAEVLGDLKEAREMPSMVEFYDTRDAARAFSELKGKEVNGRRLVLEFSRPGFNSYASNYPRSSGHGHGGQQNIPFPPRFSRGSQPPSRWSQASGACSRSAQSSSSPSPSVAARSNSSATASVVAKSGAGTSGRRKKSGRGGGGGSSSSYSHPSPSPSSSSSRQHLSGGGSSGSSSGRRSWKSRSKSSGEARFLFKEEESAAAAAAAAAASQSSCRDSRTTVMIKNIPNKYSQKLLLNMLDNHCIQCNAQISEGGAGAQPYSAYDFVYLPIDFNNKCNVGYGFVNLTSPEAAFRLYKAFHQQPWEVFNSRKICQVTYARLQGLEVLKEHFKNSKFACDNDEYMPVVFSPPRDGKQLTYPVPVAVGRALERCASLSDEAALQHAASSTTASTHAPSDVAEGGDDNDGDDDDDSSDGGDETAAGLSREAALRLSCD